MQTILWGQPASEAGLLPDSCGGGAMHRSEVYPTRMGVRNSSALGVPRHNNNNKKKGI
jgi:hypothetical protein